MVRAYSLDLRERVVAAVAAGQACRAVAKTFGVSVASVVKWSKRFRETGSAAAKPMGGKRPFALAPLLTSFAAPVSEQPSIQPSMPPPSLWRHRRKPTWLSSSNWRLITSTPTTVA